MSFKPKEIGLRIEQTQSLQMRQELRQILRMEQANLLEMPEGEFNRLLIEIERNPLFLRLYQREKLIRHQGKIEVQSKEGEGTTFTIYLPLHYEEKG